MIQQFQVTRYHVTSVQRHIFVKEGSKEHYLNEHSMAVIPAEAEEGGL